MIYPAGKIVDVVKLTLEDFVLFLAKNFSIKTAEAFIRVLIRWKKLKIRKLKQLVTFKKFCIIKYYLKYLD